MWQWQCTSLRGTTFHCFPTQCQRVKFWITTYLNPLNSDNNVKKIKPQFLASSAKWGHVKVHSSAKCGHVKVHSSLHCVNPLSKLRTSNDTSKRETDFLSKSVAQVKNVWSSTFSSHHTSSQCCRLTNYKWAWFQAYAAVLMRSTLSWDVMQRRLVILYRHFGTTYWPPKMGLMGCLLSIQNYQSTLPKIVEGRRSHCS
jgi:hypothetical protein